MSYILEALRKVEQQRGQLSPLDLSSRLRYHAISITSAPKPQVLIIALIASGAFLSGVLLVYLTVDMKVENPGAHSMVKSVSERSGWEQTAPIPYAHDKVQSLAPKNEDKQASLQSASVPPLLRLGSHPQSLDRGVIAPEGQARSAKALQNGTPKPQQAGKPRAQETISLTRRGHDVGRAPEQASSNKNPDASERQDKRSSFVKELSSGQDDTSRPTAATENDTPAEPALLSVHSPQLQGMVPEIGLDGIVYSSDPKQRVVVINMKIYNEGQITPEGITVESIRKEDVICSYRGRRFRLSR